MGQRGSSETSKKMNITAQMKKDDGLDKGDGSQKSGEANNLESPFRSKTNRAGCLEE